MDPLSTSRPLSHSCCPPAPGQRSVNARAREAVDRCLQKLCDQLAIRPTYKGSTAFSSVSLVPLLGMMLAAMHDSSKKEEILGLPTGSLTQTLEEKIHNLLGATSKRIASANNSGVFSANFLVSDPQHENPGLNDALERYYGTETKVVSIDEVVKATDELVKRKTQGHITRVLEGCEATFDIELLLGNVLSFQGLWSDPFKESLTCPESFHCADHQIIKNVMMMHTTENVQHAQYGGFSAIAKHFNSDDDQPLRFIAILPSDENPDTIDELDHETINVLLNLLNQSQLEPCELRIPKIEINSVDDQLLDKLRDILGVQFTPDVLSGLKLSPYSTLGIHNTLKVSLNEKGVKGSVTNVLRSHRGWSTRENREFFFNRPGYFAIVNGSDRLVEAVIKDGKYLVTDGPQKWAATTACKHIPEKTVNPGEEKKDFTNNFTTPEDMRRFLLANPILARGLLMFPRYAQATAAALSLDVPEKTVNPGREKRDWKESVTGPQIITGHIKENLSTRDYQRLFNKQFNSDGVLNIKGFQTDDSNFAIEVGSDDEVTVLRNRVLEEIGRDLDSFVADMSYNFRDERVFKVRIDFTGKDELFKLLEKTKSP